MNEENKLKALDKFMDLSFDVSESIQLLLKNKKLKKQELASLLGCNRSEITKWLTGSHNFTLATLSKIMAVLETDIVSVASPKLYEAEHADRRKKELFGICTDPHFLENPSLHHDANVAKVVKMDSCYREETTLASWS